MKYLLILFLATAAQAQFTTNVLLMWKEYPPEDEWQNYKLVGYRVRYGKPGNLNDYRDVETNQVMIYGLSRTNVWYFKVCALFNSGLESPDSTLAILAGIQVPSPPYNLRLVATETDLRLAFDYPVISTNINFSLYAGTNLTRASLEQAINWNLGTNTTMIIRDLAIARKWTFAVTAKRSGIEGDASNFLNVEVQPFPPPIRQGTRIDAEGFTLILP